MGFASNGNADAGSAERSAPLEVVVAVGMERSKSVGLECTKSAGQAGAQKNPNGMSSLDDMVDRRSPAVVVAWKRTAPEQLQSVQRQIPRKLLSCAF